MVPNCYKLSHLPHLASTLPEESVIHSLSSQFLPCNWAFQSQQVSFVWMGANNHSQIYMHTIGIQKPRSNIMFFGCFRLLALAYWPFLGLLTFSEASCLRVESLPRRLLALIPDSDVCIINCVARNCCREKKHSWP